MEFRWESRFLPFQGSVAQFLGKRFVPFQLGIPELSGNVLGDLDALRHCPALGNQPRKVRAGSQIPAFWKSFDIEMIRVSDIVRLPHCAVVFMPDCRIGGFGRKEKAPQVRLELTTLRLTAGCSTD